MNTIEPEHLTHPKYRADIDGLRAVAVLSVVGFHAFPRWVKGGFIGVDIFFVISGFLISSIILENLERNSFSFAEFYSRRIKRIFPALIVILISSFAFGLFTLPPYEVVLLAKQVAAGAGFISNFVLWSESGYFDRDAGLKPLLHLWSLGVEEQFYIVWPLLLWFAWKAKLNLLAVTLVVSTISFGLNIYTVNNNAVAAFYLPQTRFWELLIGSTLAYLTLFNQRSLQKLKLWNGNIQSFFGVMLFAVGMLFITKESVFPGWWALLPTIGSVLIISANSQAWMNRVVLSNRVLVWFGLISYPLYLWHWCLLSYANIEQVGEYRAIRIAIVFISIFLAWLTYILIEKPIRSGVGNNITVKSLLGLMFILVVVSALIVMKSFTLTTSANREEVLIKLSIAKSLGNDLGAMYGEKPCFRYKESETFNMFIKNGCLDNKYPNRPTVFLIGDSHSASLSLGFRTFFENSKINFLQVSSGWCEPTSNDEKNIICRDINNFVMEKIKSIKPDAVIINSHWFRASHPPLYVGDGDFMQHLSNYIYELKAIGVNRIFIVGQMPTWKDGLPNVLEKYFVRKNFSIPSKTFLGVESESLKMDDLMKSIKYPQGVTYLSVKDMLCDKFGCLTTVGPNLEKDLVVWDYGHLTKSGSEFLVNKLFGKISFSDR